MVMLNESAYQPSVLVRLAGVRPPEVIRDRPDPSGSSSPGGQGAHPSNGPLHGRRTGTGRSDGGRSERQIRSGAALTWSLVRPLITVLGESSGAQPLTRT